jgi:endonuclease
MAGVLRLPSGRLVRGRALLRPVPAGPEPGFGLYLLGHEPPAVGWEARWLRWPDFGLPSDPAAAEDALREAWARAEAERVEIACAGGHGRTGTALACLAVLDGVSSREAVRYVRTHYAARAVETPGQRRFVARFPPGPDRPVELPDVRLVIARCSVDYVGRLTAHLPSALRLLIVKADGSVLVHSDGGSYKPLNWMSPPCRLTEEPGRWSVTNKAGETLVITITEVISDTSADLGVDPGLVKDGVEAHLQELLAAQVELLGDGWRLVRREYPTPIGPVDLMCRDEARHSVAVEIKRRGEIDGSNSTEGTASAVGGHVAVEVKRVAGIDAVEQLTRYLELLNRDPLLRPVKGVLAAQSIRPQARTLAEDRGIRCVVLDYDRMRGVEPENTLF